MSEQQTPVDEQPSRLHAFGQMLNKQLDLLSFPQPPRRLVRTMDVLQQSRTQTYRVLKGEALPGLEAMIKLRHLGVSFDAILDAIGCPHIAVVDDDEQILAVMRETMEEHFLVSTFESADALLQAMQGTAFDGYVLDWRLPDMGGEALIRRVREQSAAAPIYLLTGQAAAQEVASAIAQADVLYGQKPVAPEIIISALKNAIKKLRTVRGE